MLIFSDNTMHLFWSTPVARNGAALAGAWTLAGAEALAGALGARRRVLPRTPTGPGIASTSKREEAAEKPT